MGTIASRFVFQPPKYSPGEYEAGTRRIAANGGDYFAVNGVSTCRFPARGEVETRRPTPIAILFSHGNAADMVSSAFLLSRLADFTGCTVYGYDYIGYGVSVGPAHTSVTSSASLGSAPPACSELGVYQSITEVFTYVAQRHGRVLLVGNSLGSGPSCFVAQAGTSNVCGLVLVCPFLSIMAVALRLTSSLGWLDLFDNHSRIAKAVCPVWIAHGDADVLIPITQSQTLAACVTPEGSRGHEVLTTLRGAGHNDVWGFQDLWDLVKRAVDFAAGGPAGVDLPSAS
jgi:pimeloyl-ACP methyl ester carboxylesterase